MKKTRVKGTVVLSRMNISFGAANGKSKKVKMKAIPLKKDEKIFLDIATEDLNRPLGTVTEVKYTFADRIRMFFGRKPKDDKTVLIRLINQ